MGVAVFVVAGRMAGCASKNGTSASAEPTAKPSPTLAPKEALLASTKSLTTSSYKFTIKSAYANVSGAADPTNKLAKMTAAEGSLRNNARYLSIAAARGVGDEGDVVVDCGECLLGGVPFGGV